MAETAVIAVLSKLGELAIREAKVLRQVGDDMMLLHDRLEWLQAFIRDADQKRRAGTDGLTRVWVRQTRDVAFKAEDALDQFFYQVELKNLSERFNTWKKPNFWYNLSIRHVLSADIARINRRLKQISENQKAYNIQHTPLVTSTSSTTATLAWRDDFLDDPVCLDDDKEAFNGMVFDYRNPNRVFLCIFGESGAGKFTLTNKIFTELKAQFEVCARYNMPPDSNTEVLLNGVYKEALGDIQLKNSSFRPADLPNVDVAHRLRTLMTPSNLQATASTSVASNRRNYLLLVVGGISSVTSLNCLKGCLPNDRGVRVVVIYDTESEEVARHADTINSSGTKDGTMNSGATNKEVRPVKNILVLSRLDEARSHQLFCSRAFRKKSTTGNAEYSSSHETEDTKGKKPNGYFVQNKSRYSSSVYKITGGYPLAIVVLAGLLRFKEEHGQWEAVLQQLNPEGPGVEGSQLIMGAQLSKEKNVEWRMNPSSMEANLSPVTEIERIFWASFVDLSNDLKSCLLYFAAFARHTYISANEIVYMWVAEGFVQPQQGKTMEEQGEYYLKELVSRCLVQIVETNASHGIGKVRVHMRLHGFLLSEVREAGFIEVQDMRDAFVPQSVRRIAFKSFDGRYTMPRNKFPKLRSFICNVMEEGGAVSSGNTDSIEGRHVQHPGQSLINRTISQWTCTGRAQETDQGSRGEVATAKKDMQNIKFLNESKFLRVISIMGLKLEKLPAEIGELIHLRYLLVHSSHLQVLPSEITRLLNLQTLDIRNTEVETIDPGFWKIKVLRHVLAKKLTLPETLEEELGELQTLVGVQPPSNSNWGQHNCPLHKMTNLRSAELHGFEYAKHGAALETALENMHLLGHLKLKGDRIPKCVFRGRCLQYLQTVELDGQVRWPKSAADKSDFRKLRPNLVQIKLQATNDGATQLAQLSYAPVSQTTEKVYRLPHDLEASKTTSFEE